jgi:hypothetical protein
MKKLVIAVGLIGVFALGSLAVIPANGIQSGTGYAATTESLSVPTHSSPERLRTLNMELSPDDAVLDDWLCDGMTPCIELSPRQRN